MIFGTLSLQLQSYNAAFFRTHLLIIYIDQICDVKWRHLCLMCRRRSAAAKRIRDDVTIYRRLTLKT